MDTHHPLILECHLKTVTSHNAGMVANTGIVKNFNYSGAEWLAYGSFRHLLFFFIFWTKNFRKGGYTKHTILVLEHRTCAQCVSVTLSFVHSLDKCIWDPAMHQTLFSVYGWGRDMDFGTLWALYQTGEWGTRRQPPMERDRHRGCWLATVLSAAVLVGKGKVSKVAQVDREWQGSEAVVKVSQRGKAVKSTRSAENLKQ